MQADRTPTSLLQRCRDVADADAWREFEARYAPLVIGYCISRGMQLSDAEDVRQAVMLSLSRTLPGFEYDRTRGRFRDYLGRTVRHAVARHRRRSGLAALPLAGDETADPAHDEMWEREWMRHHLRLALDLLRRTQAPAHVHIFETLLAGATAEETARLHGLTAAGVRKIHQRMRRRLRELLEENMRKEDGADGPPARA